MINKNQHYIQWKYIRETESTEDIHSKSYARSHSEADLGLLQYPK